VNGQNYGLLSAILFIS